MTVSCLCKGGRRGGHWVRYHNLEGGIKPKKATILKLGSLASLVSVIVTVKCHSEAMRGREGLQHRKGRVLGFLFAGQIT